MIRRILSMLFALMAIVVSANAQSLSFEVQANEAKISLTGATEMTALQFNLKLPEGVSVDTSNATLGNATDGQQQHGYLDADGKDDILTGTRQGAAGYTDSEGYL